MKWRALLFILLCLVVTGCAYTARTTQTACLQSVPVVPAPVSAPQPDEATASPSSMEHQIVNGYHVWTD